MALEKFNKEEEHILEAENKNLVGQEKLKTELKKTSDALSLAQNVMTMKMHSDFQKNMSNA